MTWLFLSSVVPRRGLAGWPAFPAAVAVRLLFLFSTSKVFSSKNAPFMVLLPASAAYTAAYTKVAANKIPLCRFHQGNQKTFI
jgi:hypothetical protein